MNTKEIEAIESHFKTSDKKWNRFIFEMLCDVIQKGNFTNPKTPLNMITTAVKIAKENHKSPYKALHMIDDEFKKAKLKAEQSLYIYDWLIMFVAVIQVNGYNLTDLEALLESHANKLRYKNQQTDSDNTRYEDAQEKRKKWNLKNIAGYLKRLICQNQCAVRT